MFGLFYRTYQTWQIPEFRITDSPYIIKAVQDRDSFMDVTDILGGAGSMGKYVFYEASRDILLVFRFPLSNYVNIYVHLRGADGKFGQDDGIKVATVTLSSIKPEEHSVDYHLNGWWIPLLNGFFLYLIDDMKHQETGREPRVNTSRLRELENQSLQIKDKLPELFRSRKSQGGRQPT
ncbi:hypothetical protein [Alkalicoccus luteus]|uniref:Uncharacterized protein n=1 Tax=Alkalicoccus luteus TaxID=1237094 RepID=A0A969PT07_9BACI|nr:hypothetical protein [Alkalicoccus luteus]NJP37831.1 hypothetical protein [Alkalicoccus luteus]